MMRKYLFVLFALIVPVGLYAQLKVHPYDFAEGRYNLAGDVVSEEYKATPPNTVITYTNNYVEITISGKPKNYYWVKSERDLHNNSGDGLEFSCKDKDNNTVLCTVIFELTQTTSYIYLPELNILHIYRSKAMRAK
jgi:hypothetical protein